VLETERAGARALVVFLNDFSRKSTDWNILRRVQADEAHNCALVGKLLDRAGVAHSHATGEFYDKAIAVSGRRQRIEFLLRGLGWAVREFDRAMPRIDDPGIRHALARMRETHARSIKACAAVAGKLEG
jgi:nitronate monooxygenase